MATSNLKPIKLYGAAGPNPPRVAMILSELKLPYTIENVPFGEIKGPKFVAVNPNGRIPAIYDPNTDLTLWESGAILEYLIDKYDTEHTISFPRGSNEAYLTQQWLFFQTSGQGPYFGQAVWFRKFHPEQLPSAQERYTKEVNRVTEVLEGWLSKQKGASSSGDGPWLVGNKITYADIAFLQWYSVVAVIIAKEEYDVTKYPLVNAWLEKIAARDGVKEALARSKEVADH